MAKRIPTEVEQVPPWVELGLVASSVALCFQLFPTVWWGLLAIVDVRTWTWRSYATFSTLAIVALVALRAWIERDD